MASKTQMYQLLRLLDQGAYHDDVIKTAWACWPALPKDTHQAMTAKSNADGRRARIWAAAWNGGMEHVLANVADVDPDCTDVEATIHDYEQSIDDLLAEYQRLEALTMTLIADVRLAIHDLRQGYLTESIQDLERAVARTQTDLAELPLSQETKA
jgi:hypothetical protein